ncbi:MAG: UDP-N-acetylglucosamine 2-epimerase (non-hydrolyzing) [Candidatus Omnitrophica bacterium]|nr:UDP-N-acetylglucosamine 2-epimerase (non-hydrolyzing) [Candidatus Omnitrophota bacterium]
MKLLFILGTRPDAIKLAPVIQEARKHKKIKIYICLTGQHRHMLDQVVNFFGIRPDFDLNLMEPNQNLFDITSKAILKLGDIIKKVNPDWVIVQGDTTTTFVGALCAFYNKTKIAHVEAGLRTYNKFSPFPEEINRTLTTQLADIHFAPTKKAEKSLLKENIEKKKIFITGNTGIDALFYTLDKIKSIPRNKFAGSLKNIDFSKKILLVTGHRRESFGKPFQEICLGLKQIAREFPNLEIVYPVHLNPNVRKTVFQILSKVNNMHLIEPLNYPSFVWLMKNSYLILTDSGGVQEEAPSIKKPVIVMRNVSERMEGIEEGIAKLIGTKKSDIVNSVSGLLKDSKQYSKMITAKNPYGNGKASPIIIRELLNA